MYNEIDDHTWVEEYQWIGIVQPWDQKLNVTLITPLAYYDVDQKWRTVSSNECDRYFPNNGKVARFTSNFPQWKRKRLLSFSPERIQADTIQENDPRHSFYLTYSDLDFAPLGQILDWTSRTGELFDLPALLEQGIDTEDCLSHQIYIQHRDSLYGPIFLELDRVNLQLLKPREYLQASNSGGPLLILGEYSLHKEHIITLENRSFVYSDIIDAPVRRIDLSLPQAVIKQVLKANKPIPSDDLDNSVHLVEKRIAHLASLSSSQGPEALRIELCTLQRAQYILQHQVDTLQHLHALIEELPSEHPLLQTARTLEIEQRKLEIEQEARKQCEGEQDHLRQLQGQAQIAEHQLQTLQEQTQTIQNTLVEREKEIEQAVQTYKRIQADFGTLERFMQKRLAELRQEPLQLLADLQLLTALPASLLQPLSGRATDDSQPDFIASPHERSRFFTDEYALSLSNFTENLSSLPWKEAAKGSKAATDDAKICVAALLAGLIPAPDGAGAADVWLTIARILAGGRIWSVPVPLTALSPLDLFGSIDASQRQFIPTAGGLADILLEASTHPEQLAIVLLEGIDRVPLLPVLAPLLQIYRRGRQHIQQGTTETRHSICLNLFHPRALASDDPYQKLSSFTWPKNLLLGATFDHDISSLPLPMIYTSWFVRTKPKCSMKRSRVSSQKDWQVSPQLWYTWEKELFTNVNNDQGEDWPEHLDQWQRQFYRSMQDLAIKEDDIDALLEHIWPQQS